MAQLMYGSGLRLMECIRLRVKDVDFVQGQLYVRNGKGDKDRVTVLPKNLQRPLASQLERVKELHCRDLDEGFGEVYLPQALRLKYPGAGREIIWQYVFPSKKRSVDPRSNKERRHHVMENGIQKALKRAVTAAGITKRVGCHTLRHSFATHMLEHGVHIRALQELMGHADVKTTEIYTHVMRRDLKRLKSPLDRIMEDHATH
jgi:integron integrase